MGIKCLSGIEELIIGFNAASVIQNVNIPALVISSQSKLKKAKTIVLASDLNLKERLKVFAQIFGATFEAKNADILFAISKRYKFFESLFHQSLTSKLAYYVSMPLLVLYKPK